VAVDINESIENILSFMEMRYHGRQIKIVSQLEPKLPKVPADPVQISQVIVNLITNAIYAMDKGGTLTISTQKKEGEVRIAVKDTGHGMTGEVQKKIFEPFFTTKPVGHGTGLGLSVVHGIVLDHNASIKVRSTVGKGTTFEVIFQLKTKRRKR
jgi:signal transduction histidine kinase